MSRIAADPNGNYALGRDLDFAAVSTGKGDAQEIKGTFNGQFNGMDHVINNVVIDKTMLEEDDYAGLFQAIGTKGVVRNVGVENAFVGRSDFVKDASHALIQRAHATFEVCDIDRQSNQKVSK